MEKTVVSTDKAPAAIGPYSQAVKGGGFLFCSGQIPLIPDTMELVTDGVEAQTKQVLKNLEAVLKAAGVGFQDIVKTTIFLADMGDFAAVNKIYAGCFDAAPPARATVEVSRLPKDVRVEIDAIAILKS